MRVSLASMRSNLLAELIVCVVRVCLCACRCVCLVVAFVSLLRLA